MTLTKGQKVSFTFYGKPETATIERIANGIVWLDNGRWMHAESVTPIAGRSKRAKTLRIRCDQCEIARINGVLCHETGCPNMNARYDADSGEWIKQRKCFDCGYTIDADDPCCMASLLDSEETLMTLSDIRLSDGTLPAYAWPGGYPILYLAKDNGILCPRCANAFNPEHDNDEQLEPVAYFVHYEGPAEQCEHCNALIDSAYGDPDTEDSNA